MDALDALGYRGTTVVVTGCSSGMGEATARILGELGADVHAVDIKKPSVPHVAFYETDVSQPEQVSATAAALREIGPIEFLFSCAGISHIFGPMQCMLVNYIGARQLTDEVLPALADGGGIAIIASDAGHGLAAAPRDQPRAPGHRRPGRGAPVVRGATGSDPRRILDLEGDARRSGRSTVRSAWPRSAASGSTASGPARRAPRSWTTP